MTEDWKAAAATAATQDTAFTWVLDLMTRLGLPTADLTYRLDAPYKVAVKVDDELFELRKSPFTRTGPLGDYALLVRTCGVCQQADVRSAPIRSQADLGKALAGRYVCRGCKG